jgi:hypothetical protein
MKGTHQWINVCPLYVLIGRLINSVHVFWESVTEIQVWSFALSLIDFDGVVLYDKIIVLLLGEKVKF